MTCQRGTERENRVKRTERKAEEGASPLTCGAILVGVPGSECGIKWFLQRCQSFLERDRRTRVLQRGDIMRVPWISFVMDDVLTIVCL